MEKENTFADKWMKAAEKNVDPTWARLGLPAAPHERTSGRGIGIIILDDVIPHKLIRHLGKRLKQVTVDDDFKVSCKTVTSDQPHPQTGKAEHGMMVLQLLAHLPFTLHGRLHTGLAPAANFIMLSEVEPDKIKCGLEWILQKCTEWNIQLLLNLIVPDTRVIGSMKPASEDRFAQAVKPAVQSGVLVVAANGNSKIHNNLHPAHFFAVSGYDDLGATDPQNHKPHPTVPWGRNGDGDLRPDILAPFTYLPVPYCEPNKSDRLLSYFGGSCGAAALVTGVCAHLLSRFPDLSHEQLKHMLIEQGNAMNNHELPVPKMDASKVVQILSANNKEADLATGNFPEDVIENELSLTSADPVVRSRTLTSEIEKGKISRKSLWEYLKDDSPIVKKTVISYGLRTPEDEKERRAYWRHFYKSEQKNGEKISWLHQLHMSSTGDELDHWIELIKEKELESILCVKIYLEKHYPEAPRIVHTPDPSSEFIAGTTEPVLKWYKEYRKNNGSTLS